MPKSRLLGLMLLLAAVLAGCKLGQVPPFTHWSWWAVTAPLWGPWSLLLAAALAVLLLQGFQSRRA